MKQQFLRLVRRLPIGAARQEALLFFLKLGYWPDFESPKTFNEKINHRKLFSADSLVVTCSDKIAVRNYVTERIGDEFLIPVLYTGDSITGDQLHALGDYIVAKPSHDSKSTEIIVSNSPEVAHRAATRLRAKLDTDYGKLTNQFAYSQIRPGILVEKMIVEAGKQTPDDYKIFCFRQPDGSTKMFVEVHRNREQPGYKIAWFDENLEAIAMRGSEYETRPFPCPGSWPRMKELALALSEDFAHVRVDFYCVDDQIYFGELTFFDGGGRTEYSRAGQVRHDLDREMGRLWCSAAELPSPARTNGATHISGSLTHGAS